MRLLVLCMAVSMVLVSGCARVAAVSGATTAERPTSGKGTMLPRSDIRASGFLGNYSQLEPVSGEQYLWRYVKPGVNWKQYEGVFIEPMEVWLNPEADRTGIQPEVYSQVDRLFKEIVAKEFQPHGYQLAARPGPGVLVFRGALTGVTPIRQGFEPSDVLPIKAAVNAGKYAFGAEPYYIVLSGEIEMLDGASGERVLAAVGARRGFETTTKGSQITWSELKDTFTWVAQRWRHQLDRARGVAG
jgi:Protein of unknown function (DUF3313)